ncbi:MAG: hypothetical protein KDD64_12625 [Bdellovibrionales bacterium]|nr:hypothetical protein [Bdellovibrionales bacterium]
MIFLRVSRDSGVSVVEYVLLLALLVVVATPSLEELLARGGSKICTASFDLEGDVGSTEGEPDPNDPQGLVLCTSEVNPNCVAPPSNHQECDQLVQRFESGGRSEGISF